MPTDRTQWKHILVYLSAIFLLTSIDGFAQQKVYGNVFIPAGAEVTLFGTQDFANNAKISLDRSSNNSVLHSAADVPFLNVNENSFVNGAVKKSGTALLVFPVGDGTFYGPFAAAADATSGVYYHTNPGDASFLPTSKQPVLGFVSTTEYWQVKGSNSTFLTLTWNESSALAANQIQFENIRIVGWKDGLWTEIPSKPDVNSILGGTSSLAAGSVTTTAAITPSDFDAFTLGAGLVALPVTLTDFQARKESNTALLSWATAVEYASDRFIIQRSSEGKMWQDIGSVKSFGESVVQRTYHFEDAKPVQGLNYYRLKMLDMDGTFAFSSIKSLYFDLAVGGIVLYPNPASNVLSIRTSGNNRIPAQQISVTDLNGRNYDGLLKWKGNDLSVEKLSNGIYLLKLSDVNGKPAQIKFVVQR